MREYKPQPMLFGKEYSNVSVKVTTGGVYPYIGGDGGNLWLSTEDARQLAANLLAACDAADRLEQEII